MLTIDFDRLGVRSGESVLDVGCGAGRHAFELYRRGTRVVALDRDAEELKSVAGMFAAMQLEGEVPQEARAAAIEGDALALPFPDDSLDRVIASEILEHIPDDQAAIAELARVLRPGGTLAITVPRWLPEKVCWALSDAYHQVEGGHVRIYRADELTAKVQSTGLIPQGQAHAHALHSPYWWLKCAVGVDNDQNVLVSNYHRLLVWDMMKAPALTRQTERLLNPFVGKSVVLYFQKPDRQEIAAERKLAT